MKKLKFPFVVSEGGVTARIRKISQTKNGKSYTLFVVDYSLLGQRKRETRASLEGARQVALNACRQIADGRQESLTLTNDDRMIYLRAIEAVNPLGVSLDSAAREYAEARAILNGRASLAEACRDWARRHSAALPRKTVAEAGDDCVEAQRADGKSVVRVKRLQVIFRKLARDINLQVSDLTPAIISQWLAAQNRAERTKRNYRDAIGFLCRWCSLRGYVARGTNWLEGVQNYSARKLSEIEICTPQEITSLLNVAGDMTPFIAIAAFAGLRHAEIARLDWREIDLEDGFIEVIAAKSKTGERRLVPIHGNLKKWLAPFRPANGRGKVIGYENTTKQLLRVARAAGVEWRHNALRHSCISYRVAECADVPRVADEAGNSPAIIRGHYLRRVRPAAAAEWFNIVPPDEAATPLLLPLPPVAATPALTI